MSGFSDPLVGGLGTLVRDYIQSPNYVPGVLGWRINKDGTAEFHGLTISGGTQIATFVQGTAPVAINVGDLWFNSSAGYAVSRWDGGAWVAFAWGTTAIAAGAITTPKIAANAVDATLIAANAVGAAAIAAGAVGTAAIAAGAITSPLIATNAVIAGQIAAGAIDAMTINAGALTAGTISSGSIGSSAIVASSIGNTDIIFDLDGGMLLVYALAAPTVQIITALGAGTFTPGAGVTTVKSECWGAGGSGSGGRALGIYGGSSGCGGEYARDNTHPCTPGVPISYFVGTGGAGGAYQSSSGNGGQDTTFDTTGTPVVASGGKGALGGYRLSGGAGSTAPIHFSGGGNAITTWSGAAGGGSSGGTASAGNVGHDGVSNTVAGTGGAAVGGGAAGGAGGVTSNGVAGTAVGGGGGGGGGGAGNWAGGAGGRGQIRLTYAGTLTLLASIASQAGTDAYGVGYPEGIRAGSFQVGAGVSAKYYYEKWKIANAQSIVTATQTKLTGMTVGKQYIDYPTAMVLATGIWTCPATGVYQVFFSSAYTTAPGAVQIALMIVDNAARSRGRIDATSAGNGPLSLMIQDDFTVGDTLEFDVFHAAGTNRTIQTTAANQGIVSIRRAL